jgi:molybdenum cofactor synthesis domain-containing protein
MVEETERPDRRAVLVQTPVHPLQNVGRRGADIPAGQRVLQAEDLLTPSRVGVLAALGITSLTVWARPTVAILSTGNEIVDPGSPLAPGQIYDINRYTLGAIASGHGAVPRPCRTVHDSVPELERAIADNADADVLVFSGGSSVGERDLMLDALSRQGRVLFHGIAVKPGKPTAFGLIDGRPFFGMPGNPTSCLSNAYLLLIPVLRRMAHLPPYEHRTARVPLARRIVSTTGRHQFYTVRIEHGEAVPAFKASGDITSMSHADGFIEIPAHTDIVEQGQLVDVRFF